MDITMRLREPLGRHWSNELVGFDLAGGIPNGPTRVRRNDGAILPAQCTGGKLWFLADLEPGARHEYQVIGGGPERSDSDITISRSEDTLDICNSITGMRIPAGEHRYPAPVPAEEVAAPLLAVRTRGGKWIGRGWFNCVQRIKAWRSEITAEGPVFAEARLHYEFESGRCEIRLRLLAGAQVILIEEEYDLGEDQEQVNDWCFSLHEGFRPRVARWSGHRADPEFHQGQWTASRDFYETVREYEYRIDYSHDHPDWRMLGWNTWWLNSGTYWGASADRSPQADFVGLFRRHPGQWRNPAALRMWTTAEPDIFLALPLNVRRREWEVDGIDLDYRHYTGWLEEGFPATTGRRQWGILISTWGQAVRKDNKVAGSGLCRARIKYGELPLNKVKDWVLEWEDPQPPTYPRLFMKPGQVEAWRERAGRYPELLANMPDPNRHLRVSGWADTGQRELQYLLTEDSTLGRELLDHPINYIRPDGRPDSDCGLRQNLDMIVEEFLDGEGDTGMRGHFLHGAHWLKDAAIRFDVVMSLPDLTDDDRRQLRARMAFCAHKLADLDWYPRGTGFHLGNLNMPPRAEAALGIAACTIPTHPHARQWTDRARKHCIDALAEQTFPGGAWQECPRYQFFSMRPFVELALAINYAGFPSFLADENFRQAMRFAVRLLSPRDPRFGYRTLAELGNTGSGEGMAAFGHLAAATVEIDPEFSREMQWAWNEAGRFVHLLSQRQSVDPGLPAAKPDLSSRRYPGFGAILRAHDDSDRETWLTFHEGACDGHYEGGSQGSFHLYAKGVPLCLDFGSLYDPIVRRPYMHNRISVDHECHDDVCGDVTLFGTLPGADMVRGKITIDKLWPAPEDPWRDHAEMRHNMKQPSRAISPHCWQRNLVFVKDDEPLGPNYLVVRDEFSDEPTPPTDWNVWCLAETLEVRGQRAHFQGQFDVDLDVFVAHPAEPDVVTGAWAHSYLQDFRNRQQVDYHTFYSPFEQAYERIMKRPFQEKQLVFRLRQGPGEGYLVVLFPRLRDEAPPRFDTLTDACGVRVASGAWEHTILLPENGSAKVDDLEFTGPVAVLKQQADGRIDLSLPGGGRFRNSRIQMDAKGPAELRLDPTNRRGTIHGAANVRINLPEGTASHVTNGSGSEEFGW